MGGLTIMTYTDKTFFRFPVKVYDPYSLANVQLEEDKEFNQNGELTSLPIDWVAGGKLCIATDIISIVENYHKGMSHDEVKEGGFPCTVITIRENQETSSYECVWPMDLFLEKLNKYMVEKQAYIA